MMRNKKYQFLGGRALRMRAGKRENLLWLNLLGYFEQLILVLGVIEMKSEILCAFSSRNFIRIQWNVKIKLAVQMNF